VAGVTIQLRAGVAGTRVLNISKFEKHWLRSTFKHFNILKTLVTLDFQIKVCTFKENTLSDERIAMLDSAGFVWTFGREGQRDMQWKSMFGKLEQYKREHNHCNVPRSEKSLDGWVNSQRIAFKKDTLSDERKEMLDSVGFVWTLRS